MKKHFKHIVSGLMVGLLMLSFASCKQYGETASENKEPYNSEETLNTLQSSVVACNKNYELMWDLAKNCVILKHIETGRVWSTIPYDYFVQEDTDGRASVVMESPINVEYVSKLGGSAKSVTGKIGSLKNGRVSSERIENGIKVTYYFDKQEIAISVSYVLRESGVALSILSEEIQENHSNFVYKIHLAPFLSSAKNDENSYIFVPSGSGALLYTDERGAGDARTFTGEVYGIDPSQQIRQKLNNEEPIRLPVFGAKDGDFAICGIIESGAEAAEISAQVGESRVGYSSAYATFSIRGKDVSSISYGGAVGRQNIPNYADSISSLQEMRVGYYPLFEDDANYNGMAKVFRKFIFSKYDVDHLSVDDVVLTLKILGGAELRQYFLGIPYNKTKSMTTFDETLSLVNQIYDSIGSSMDVQLVGFGKSGLDVGEIGGGFEFGSVMGKLSTFHKLQDYCEDNKIPLYVDYDIVRFDKSSNGFSKSFDTTKTASGLTAYQYYYSIALRDIDSFYPRFQLLKRNLLSSAMEKLIKSLQKNEITDIGLGALSSMAYSDYSESTYYLKNQMSDDVVAIISNMKKEGVRVAVNSANDYAAAVSNKIMDAITWSGQYDSFDQDIPFYSMVFKGFIPISSFPVNMATDKTLQYLRSLEVGSGISFNLINNYSIDIATVRHSGLASSVYEDNKKDIIEMVKECSTFLESVSKTSIRSHEILENGLHKTVFENDIVIYINYNSSPAQINGTIIEAKSFLVVG